jgi:hypothetical protein
MVGLLVVACGTDERNADGGVGSAPTTLPSTGQTITQTSDDIAPGENKSVPAPIHDIAISVLAAKPPNATLIFTSGLPDSCYEFGGYELSRDGDVFTLDVHNLTAVGLGRPCMEIYKTIEHEAIIDTQVAACESYTVIANGESRKVDANCPAIGVGPAGDPPPEELPEENEVFAPISAVSLTIAESFPVQYFAVVQSGLPNGCVRFGGYKVDREETTIKITVTNMEPANPDVECDLEYRTVETSIGLGRDDEYEPGTTYTIVVNGDVETSFTSTGPPPTRSPETPVLEAGGPVVTLGEEFNIVVGETRLIGATKIALILSEILDDSRCPTDAMCVWAGTAKAVVNVKSPENSRLPGGEDRTLELNASDPTVETSVVVNTSSGTYFLEFVSLEPGPMTTREIVQADYVATLRVTKIEPVPPPSR